MGHRKKEGRQRERDGGRERVVVSILFKGFGVSDHMNSGIELHRTRTLNI